MKRRVVIVGAGFTGMAAALELLDHGVEVTVIEADKTAGGLAGGFKQKEWKWPVESFYHHIFTNDQEAFSIAKRVGVKLMVKSVATDARSEGSVDRLDTPISLLKYRKMTLVGRVWMGVGLMLLKVSPMWTYRWYEKTTITKTLPMMVGKEGYTKVWEPLMKAKFGKFLSQVNLAWFWARVKKRTKSLAYPEGGFVVMAEKMVEEIKRKGGKVVFETKVKSVKRAGAVWLVETEKEKIEAEMVLLTVPGPIAAKLVGAKERKLGYLWGQTLVLELKRSLMKSYWLNILEKDWPFLVAVEHDQLVGKDKYGGRAVVYLGNYLEDGDKRLELNEKKLLELYLPYIKKINPMFGKSWIVSLHKRQSPFAQPVFGVNYSKKIGKTKIDDGLWMANMAMVYPWDRGINYALEMGRKVASQMLR